MITMSILSENDKKASFEPMFCIKSSFRGIAFAANQFTSQIKTQIGKSYYLLACLLLACLTFILSGCSEFSGQTEGNAWGWYIVSPFTDQGQLNLKFLLGGYRDTILISVISMAISITLGFAIASLGLSNKRSARWCNIAYVEFIRSIPLLPLIFWVYYGLPAMTGLTLNVFWAGVLALALSDSAFEAEIFRGGIQSIGRGQTEAAQALGLNDFKTLRFVILPQAIRRILPPLGNQFVYMLKMSALVSVIGLHELTRRANELVVSEYRPLELYTILILEYLVLILVVSQGVRWLEFKLGSDERKA